MSTSITLGKRRRVTKKSVELQQFDKKQQQKVRQSCYQKYYSSLHTSYDTITNCYYLPASPLPIGFDRLWCELSLAQTSCLFILRSIMQPSQLAKLGLAGQSKGKFRFVVVYLHNTLIVKHVVKYIERHHFNVLRRRLLRFTYSGDAMVRVVAFLGVVRHFCNASLSIEVIGHIFQACLNSINDSALHKTVFISAFVGI